MATPASSLSELTVTRPIELSFALPKAHGTRIYVQLTLRATSIILFLTTGGDGDPSTSAYLGSFVCALPDRLNPGQSISTPLCSNETSVDFTTRLAKLLARKFNKPVYVGNSISFANTGLGGTVEEELEGFRKVVEVVMDQIKKGIE